MTPKEKAKELLDKIYYCQRYADNEDYIPLEAWKRAKQCALIAVDEIINTLNHDIRDLDVRGNILLDLIKYWREVKQEIEKL